METEILKGRMCGTCALWGRANATSARNGALMPNAKCRCFFGVKISKKLPSSIKKVNTLYHEGKKCGLWKPEAGKIEVIKLEKINQRGHDETKKNSVQNQPERP